MRINQYELESINELPIKKSTPVLTADQVDKLEICRDWIIDVAASDESVYSGSTSELDEALLHIDRVLDNQPCEYVAKSQTKPSLKKMVRSLVLDLSAHGFKISFAALITAGLGIMFCQGLDCIEQSKGVAYNPDWSNRAKVFEGLATCSLSVLLGAAIVGICVSDKK